MSLISVSWIIYSELSYDFIPSCTKVFGTFYEGGGGGWADPPPPMISKTVDPTKFNFDRPLRLSMRGEKLVKLMI